MITLTVEVVAQIGERCEYRVGDRIRRGVVTSVEGRLWPSGEFTLNYRLATRPAQRRGHWISGDDILAVDRENER